MRNINLVFLFFCALIPSYVAAQNRYLATARRFDIEDGLPHRQVNTVIEDCRGFIWTGTLDGLARFDGQHFKVYTKDNCGLQSNQINWLVEDAAGKIWVNNNLRKGDIDILDPITGKVTPFEQYFAKNLPPVALSHFNRYAIRHSDGTLFWGTENRSGWISYHPKTGWKTVALPDRDSSSFRIFKVTKRHTVWGLLDKSLIEADSTGRIIQQYDAAPNQTPNLINGDTGEPDGFFVNKLMLAPQVEVKADGRVLPVQLPDPTELIYRIFYRIDGDNLRLQHFRLFDQQNQVVLNIGAQFPEIKGLIHLFCIRDTRGQIWIGTEFGLVQIEIRRDYFKRFLQAEKPNKGIGCRGLLEYNGKLYINTEVPKLSRRVVEIATGKTESIASITSLGIAYKSSAQGIPEFYVSTAYNSLWLIKGNQSDATGKCILTLPEEHHIWSIYIDKPDQLLLGTYYGLYLANPVTGAFRRLNDANYPELDQIHIIQILKSKSGNIWLVSNNGLYEMDNDGHIIGRYNTSEKDKFHHLPSDLIIYLYEDTAGIFWLGTSGEGLIRWDKNNGISETIGRNNGLLNRYVYAVFEDKYGCLWLPTDYGIAQFDKKELKAIRTWLPADGVTQTEFNRLSYTSSSDGMLYFGGINGVTAFNPGDFRGKSVNILEWNGSIDTTRYERLVLSDFSIMGGDGQLKNQSDQLLATRRITVLPDDRYIQIEFALLNFIDPKKTTYAWRIEGIDKEWNYQSEPLIRLSSFRPGNYRLQIKAQSFDGVDAVNILDFELIILPPVYLRWWFLLSTFCLVMVAIRTWMSWRLKTQARLEAEVARQTATIRMQADALKKLDETKNRFFANISHELRTPITLILGPIASMLKGNQLSNRDITYAKTAQQHGRHLLNVVNEILDLSKLEAGKMQVQETNVLLYPFVRQLISVFESHAELDGIHFVFEYRVTDNLSIRIDQDKVQKILNNLLSNAFKFTSEGGEIGVKVTEKDTNILIVVQDTGIGMHADDLPFIFDRFYQTNQSNKPRGGGTGIGLALCKEFTLLIGGKIWVESSIGKGSSFYFEFPKKEVLGAVAIPNNDEAELLPAMKLLTSRKVLTPQNQDTAYRNSLKTILLVEDSLHLSVYICQILAEHYNTMKAENGQEALNRLAMGKRPDLIITDVMMPVMDGYQFVEQLKANTHYKSIPIIMLTARADLQDKIKAFNMGVDAYLLKPFEEEELLAQIENLLTKKIDSSSNNQTEESTASSENTISEEEMNWLAELEKMVSGEMSNFDFNAEVLTEKMFMSRTKFYQQTKRIVGMTPAEYIQEMRFNTARDLLKLRKVTSVKAAATSVGLRDVEHFSRQFKIRFGKAPSEYIV